MRLPRWPRCGYIFPLFVSCKCDRYRWHWGRHTSTYTVMVVRPPD